MQVYAIQQRSGDARAITLHHVGTASAPATGVACPAARARVHRGDQLEASREFTLPSRARDRDHARFERLAQDFQCASIPLGELVQKKHALVGERYFTWARFAAAAYKRNGTRGVMRRPEGALAPSRRIETASTDGCDRRGFERFFFAGFRQQARKARSQQGLAASWWPDE